MKNKNSRLGEIRKNNFGTEMKIVSYRKQNDIDVEFLDKHHFVKEHTTYTNFYKGEMKSPFDKTVADVGYTGIGKYKTSVKKIHTVEYSIWKQMILRCYFKDNNNTYPTYYGKSEVCEEWHNFQNFAEWYTTNAYDIGNERLHVDKDIKYQGNKIYSPYHCILVPQSINEQFKDHNGRKKETDTDLPFTIRRTDSGKFSVSHRSKYLGTYTTVEECVEKYLKSKKKYITELVEKYNTMPDNVRRIVLEAEIN